MEQEKRQEFVEKAMTILEEENRRNKKRIRELEMAVVEIESREGIWLEEKDKLIKKIGGLETKVDEREKGKTDGAEKKDMLERDREEAEEGKNGKGEEGEREGENNRQVKASESRERKLKERGLLIKKGRGWRRGDDLDKIIKEKIGEKDWELEVMGEERRKGWMVFRRKEDREELWEKRKELKKKGRIDLICLGRLMSWKNGRRKGE